MASPEARLRTDFDDKTGYERLALSVIRDAEGLYHGRGSDSGDDIRGPNPILSVGAAVGGARAQHAVEELLVRLRPLVFGAAYKVLDHAVEFVMALNNAPQRGGRWFMDEKKKFCDGAPPSDVPAPLDRDAWARTAGLYSRLLDERHSVTHRQVHLLPDGSLQGEGRGGKPLTPIPADEVDHFAVAAYMLGEVLATGRATRRQLNAFQYELDQLAAFHGQSTTGAFEPQAAFRKVVDNLVPLTQGRWAINVDRIVEHLHRQNHPEIADLELHTEEPTGDRLFRARLEELPTGSQVQFDEAALPSWISVA